MIGSMTCKHRSPPPKRKYRYGTEMLQTVGVSRHPSFLSHLGRHALMVANSHDAQHVRHFDLDWPREVQGERNVNGQLANVEERRREGWRKEAQLVLRNVCKFRCTRYSIDFARVKYRRARLSWRFISADDTRIEAIFPASGIFPISPCADRNLQKRHTEEAACLFFKSACCERQ